ncbi:MAG: PspA-associated protein PspAA [Ktedonobacterales bacterium]
MIVRIMTDDQYRLDDSHLAELHRLDDALDGAEERGDAAAFTAALQELTAFVQQHGTPVGIDEVIASDMIVPAPDMSLDEAKERLHTLEMKSTQLAGQ